MSDEIKKKIKALRFLFIIFLIFTVILLIGAIIGGIAGKDDIINTMPFVLGIPCAISLALTITFGVKFRRLAKERNASEIE
ncbi:MAG: hypothetical protein FK730_10365 [Asgard group archaeon]|nr:hypothetical protein [Asgard group archaeon]